VKTSQNVNEYTGINLERKQLEKLDRLFITFIMSSSNNFPFFDFIFALENKNKLLQSFKSRNMTIFTIITPTSFSKISPLLGTDDFFC
jgi:hypothetical protein